jgi:pilus assembly protein CpaB
MKNPRAIAMLVMSLLIGVVATVLAAGWIVQQGQAGSNKVVVAAIDIELGSRLNPQLLKTVDWPSGSIPSGAVSDALSLQDRVVKTSVLRGEPILEAKLAPVGSKGGLSAVIPEGKRAMTVRVNDVIGVAGFALPGNYVDIVVNTQLDGEGRGDKQISKIVLEHILVLAVAQEADRDETKPKVVNAVTLELTPEQAEKLDLARSVGTLSLVLRNQVDNHGVATVGIMKRQLLAGDLMMPAAQVARPSKPAGTVHRRKPRAPVEKPPVEKPAVHKDTVEVIKGVQKATVEF